MSKKTKIILAVISGCFVLGLIGLIMGEGENKQEQVKPAESVSVEERYNEALKKCAVSEAYDNIRMPEAAREATLSKDATFAEWIVYGKKTCEDLYKNVYSGNNIEEFEKNINESWDDVKNDKVEGKALSEYLGEVK